MGRHDIWVPVSCCRCYWYVRLWWSMFLNSGVDVDIAADNWNVAVRGMTAGGSRIIFYGRRMDAFPPLGAYFIPPEHTGLPDIYGFASFRSEGPHWSLNRLHRCVNIFIFIHQWMVERMQYNIQNDAITLTTLKYSATFIVHIWRYQQY